MSKIDYSTLRSLTARELCRALEHDGFTFRRQRSIHRRYIHRNGRRVTVPFTRDGDTFAIGTLKSMIETQARWTAEDLLRLGLITSHKAHRPAPRHLDPAFALTRQRDGQRGRDRHDRRAHRGVGAVAAMISPQLPGSAGYGDSTPPPAYGLNVNGACVMPPMRFPVPGSVKAPSQT